jgi:hypothetical protein
VLGVRRGEARGGFYNCLGLYYDGNKPSTAINMIPKGSRRYRRR